MNKYFLGVIAILFVGAILIDVYFFKAQKPALTAPQDLNSEILADIKESGIDCGIDGCGVDKVFGDYAKGIMPMAYWIAKKINNTWQVVVTGNGIPNCDEVDKFSVPKEIYGNCIEPIGELRF